jgi:DNA primase
MNCNQFNSIKLEEVLVSLGHHPTKQNEKEAWYLNPFSTETQASFKLNKRNNVWYLHSEGIGGNNIDFMKKYLNASIKEVLEWAENKISLLFNIKVILILSKKL